MALGRVLCDSKCECDCDKFELSHCIRVARPIGQVSLGRNYEVRLERRCEHFKRAKSEPRRKS